MIDNNIQCITSNQMFKLARQKNTYSKNMYVTIQLWLTEQVTVVYVTLFRWRWRCFFSHHRRSLVIGHGAGGDAALAAALAVGSLSAAWRALLLTLFLLSFTLLFIFTDVPAEAKTRNEGSPLH